MPLVLLLLTLSLLQACIAPAVSDTAANYASPSSDTTRSRAPSDPIANTCKDLDHCRSLVGIITSCLATIFACVWVAVHPNVPGPKQSWTSRKIESIKVVVVTLLVPEWVLAWAVRQFLRARVYAKELEAARKGSFFINLLRVVRQFHRSQQANSTNQRKQTLNNCHSLYLRFTAWTITHGFLMTMGGFHFYRGGKPMFPLEYDDVLALVESRSLVPPTSDELGDKSKGDALSKTIAILQTLWFVAQCIARRVENLAITNLEIMTLAYTAITVAMYAAWWHKPLNMRCPVRVKGNKEFVKDTRRFRWAQILFYVTGDQDHLTTLNGKERVPTFWSSCTTGGIRLRLTFEPQTSVGKLPLYADITALLVAMVFGAVHCTAWSYVFPSLEQQKMWRVCALAITTIPLPMAVAFAAFDPFLQHVRNVPHAYTQVICMALGALLYIIARIILLVLSFTTLRHLPLSAYQTVQWTTWIPHV
ncbi:hypothetical protein FIBSPDRAFT_744398 [Athelia psychrophila]|uniref:Uncharacterized protein n=1 Tax=Athelia psychrophila TaxID=1759441 RepID=A0A166HS22_9AGAM|nr:hypothetical protein FIBSPDRAFT_744398 [Fibularhizoctonia sp. CBS 109695]